MINEFISRYNDVITKQENDTNYYNRYDDWPIT